MDKVILFFGSIVCNLFELFGSRVCFTINSKNSFSLFFRDPDTVYLFGVGFIIFLFYLTYIIWERYIK